MKLLHPDLDAGVELCVDPWTEPFWDAARQHRLIIAKCAPCGHFRSPPTPYCPKCLSQEIEWVELAGGATLYTYTIVRHPPAPELATKVPYVIGIVVLDDTNGVKFMTNVVNCTPDDVHIGMRLHVVWDDDSQGNSIPRFGP